MRAWLALAGAAAVIACTVVRAQGAVQRCEAPDGRVTYSNVECPAGAQAVRTVDTAPPVAAGERRGAELRARRDPDAARRVDAQRAAPVTRARPPGPPAAAAQPRPDACGRAQSELDRAQAERADLGRARPVTIEQLRRADEDLRRRTLTAERACGR